MLGDRYTYTLSTNEVLSHFPMRVLIIRMVGGTRVVINLMMRGLLVSREDLPSYPIYIKRFVWDGADYNSAERRGQLATLGKLLSKLECYFTSLIDLPFISSISSDLVRSCSSGPVI